MTPEDLDLARSLRDALEGVEGAPEPPAIPAPLLTMLQREGREAGLSRVRWAEPWEPAWSCSTTGAPDWMPDLTHDAWAATLLGLLPPYQQFRFHGMRLSRIGGHMYDGTPAPEPLTIAAARAFVAWRDGTGT
jgi:hypothetical protein